MSKKNSSVILKNGFQDFKDLSKVYLNFKKKLVSLKTKSYVVAISGGPDSLALSALTQAYKYENNVRLFYVLINHNIRNNSLKEANQVKALLKKHKINVVIITNKEKIKTNIQGQARKIRYDLLSKYCLKKNVKVILTAHNLEDQVETFFIRLSRGSGLSGLSAMKPLSILNGKIKIFRPLLEVKKDELIKISKQVYGKFFIDPSNNDTKYLRVKIRNLKKHLFKSGIKYEQIIKSINNLASSKATLEEYFKIIFKKTIQRSRGEILIDLKKFNDYNDEIKIGIINESIKKLKKNYYNPRSQKVMNLINNLNGKKFRGATLGGCFFFIKKDQLCLKKEEK